MNAAALASVAARRSALYWLLAEFLLTCPQTAFVTRLRREFSGIEVATGSLESKLSALRDALPEDGDAAGVDNLAVEYTRLFGSVKAGYGLPPPYESVARAVMTPADVVAAVNACYADAGLASIIQPQTSADHLGIELKFMALLCHREMEAWQQGHSAKATSALERQRDFLDAHLLKWAPQYLGLVLADARHAFYRGVAALALDVLPEDRALLNEMLVELDAA